MDVRTFRNVRAAPIFPCPHVPRPTSQLSALNSQIPPVINFQFSTKLSILDFYISTQLCFQLLIFNFYFSTINSQLKHNLHFNFISISISFYSFLLNLRTLSGVPTIFFLLMKSSLFRRVASPDTGVFT
jgi:hypothetical protein